MSIKMEIGSNPEAAPIPNANLNRLHPDDRGVHQWYRFVLSFPPHLVRTYLQRFEVTADQQVLDPFCGTGTTLVECKKAGIPSVGVEANPICRFASEVKLNWSPNPNALLSHARSVATAVTTTLAAQGIDDNPIFASPHPPAVPLRELDPERAGLLLSGSISPLPLHKTLVLVDAIFEMNDLRYTGHEMLALANALVNSISNLHFGPEVGVGVPKQDASVVGSWMAAVRTISDDLLEVYDHRSTPGEVWQADSRQLTDVVKPNSIDAVITSPPYPNEKDYTRTTRLESVILGGLSNKYELRKLKQSLMRSNSRGVYKGDDDDQWVEGHPVIQQIAQDIEERRMELGKTSGFERQYARVTKLYFGGMAKHLRDLQTVLRPGAHLAYVVGDQASYLRVMIRTGQLIADIAESMGYEVLGIDLFRTRLATATKEQMREEVVVLRWPGW